jgi:hypothetical protein
MHVQNDRIAGSFDPQHRFSQEITSDAGDDVLSPQTAISPIAMPAILELTGGIVCEHDNLVALILDLDVWCWISELAAARQFQMQECTNALEGNTATRNDTATLVRRSPCRSIDVVPEPLDLRMRSAPFSLELLLSFPKIPSGLGVASSGRIIA